MIENLFAYLKSFIQLSDDELSALEKILKIKKIKKKELYVENSQICQKVLFFNEGYFRFYQTEAK